MKEHPILMNSDMVRAILRGQKTQTRRPVMPQPVWHPNARPPLWVWTACGREITWVDDFFPLLMWQYCPLGEPGDRLWVRETFARHPPSNEIAYRADGEEFPYGDGFSWQPKWTPAIHMPRALSRITLEITKVTVEQLRAIRNDEAILEGVLGEDIPRMLFIKMWDAIYEKRGLGWDANPWVWVVSFKRI